MACYTGKKSRRTDPRCRQHPPERINTIKPTTFGFVASVSTVSPRCSPRPAPGKVEKTPGALRRGAKKQLYDESAT